MIRDADGGSPVTPRRAGRPRRSRVWADARVRLVAGLHRRHAARRAAPPLGRGRADDLPAGRVPLRPGPDRAGARPDLARRPGASPWVTVPGGYARGVRRRRARAGGWSATTTRTGRCRPRWWTGCSSTRSGRRRPGSPRAGASWCWRTPADRDAVLGGDHARGLGAGQRWLAGMRRAPLIVVPHSNKSAYLDRYAEPDKGWTDRDEARWPVPYWDIDTGFAALLMLLTAVDEGLGACFFGIPPERTRAYREAFGVPEEFTPIGAIDRRLPGARSEVAVAEAGPPAGRRGGAPRALVLKLTIGEQTATSCGVARLGTVVGARLRRGVTGRDLQGGPGRPALPRARPDAQAVGRDPAAPAAPRPADHHQARAGARQAARRGLHVLRRPVPARRAVERRPLPGGRPAPGAAGGAAAAQPDPRPGAGARLRMGQAL